MNFSNPGSGATPAKSWRDAAGRSPAPACVHGGASLDAIGDALDHLGRAEAMISADVLDAWFPPSPRVTDALREHLDWIVRTSPPTECRGMTRSIARARGLPEDCVLPGAGSSDLIFRAFPRWFTAGTRALVLEPTYGEYMHLLERVVGGRVEGLALAPERGHRLDLELLAQALRRRYDLVVIVNPNSPTGTHVPGALLAATLAAAPPETLVWIDETYVDYAGPEQSLERWAVGSRNVVVSKSMSKVFALSGLRVAYLCGPSALVADLRVVTPPWAVSLPGQIAAARAVEDPGYYAGRWHETHALRTELAAGLEALGFEVVPGVANFLLCRVGPGARRPEAAALVAACREHGLFLRDLSGMSSLGSRAFRIAVKDAATNLRMLEILERVV